MSIELRGVSYTYGLGTPLAHPALKDINLTIADGEIVGLIGHTGSGKSTLIQHLNGLLKPTKGQVLIDGVDISAKGVRLREIRQRVGLVFQYPEHQLFEETVAADIAFGPKNLGLEGEALEARVRKAMSQVHLNYEELRDRSPFELSGGQKRRVALAGVLAMEPKVLVLDEPSAGLDPKSRRDLLALVKELHESGLSIVFVTHNMSEVAMLAERLVVMHRGRIAMDGTPREIFSQGEKLAAMGLGVPEVTQIVRELRAGGITVPEDILTVDEAKTAILHWIRQRKEGL
ncbi:MAG: energy-coupling factor transporter ATPase [Firmicutes bacterium]|nr:energy-coupling factor transporter ATPase [Bacillota bacterium]